MDATTDMRLTRAGIERAFGMSPESVTFFEKSGAIRFDADGQISIQEFTSAILANAMELGEVATVTMRSATELANTIAETGEIMQGAIDAIPDTARGARAMRQLLDGYIDGMRKLHADVVAALAGAEETLENSN